MVKKDKNQTKDPLVQAIKEAYKAGQEDEALEPIVATDSSGQPVGRLRKGDYVVFYDIRGEREIELTQSLVDKDFSHFPVEKDLDLNFVTMIEYDSSLKVKVAFPPDGKIKNTLGEILSQAGLNVLKISESEKAIHVGYFMNGKNEDIFPGEKRIVVPSPEGISSYGSTPEMNASGVTAEISSNLRNPNYRVLIANFANVDVVGHIEAKEAVIQAVEEVDLQLGKVVEDCRKNGVTLVVTSDHGTVEEWLYPDGAVNTGHTTSPVPFILADFSLDDPESLRLKPEGELADVAPTLLDLLGLEKPSEMTGSSLLLNSSRKEGKERKILLLILDGWGMRKEKEGNLIAQARTSHFDELWSRFPCISLLASGEAVGMPAHTVGNSEAGHLHLGAGRRIFLDRVKIDRAVEDGSFSQNESFLWAMEGAKRDRKALHLLGIVSFYSSHGTNDHLFALLRLAEERGVERVFIHSLIGRRGEKPESGAVYVAKVQGMCRSLALGHVVTVIGRFWALDREENWDRVEKAYRALVYGEGTPGLYKEEMKK
ncbi:MAG: alkaline phosphatase family protein [Candidatus Aminicenantes bacterium]|nr:alkaline phosphatase family protein [Candidatus Aminicenantes bacterium]MDH5706074.1 alkaline phosphatase family protein [Candidatus Aminicenantes bacterium]